MNKPLRYILAFFLLFPLLLFAQEKEPNADELFQKARSQAFDNKDYPSAIRLAKRALEKAPDYTDVSIFLGRVYTWSGKVDSARFIFQGLEARQVKDADFFLAYASLEYWNHHFDKANAILDRGLSVNKNSEELLLLQAKVNYSSKHYTEAYKNVQLLLALNPGQTEARSLSGTLQALIAKNAIGLSYDYTHFDKQFDNDWHIVSLSYKRQTPIGPVILTTNYANKFADNGVQFELEAYPHLSDMFYLYVETAYSGNVGIFPKYRTGVSLYANLPESFEGEVGYRQLHFYNNIWVYTASVGKYYQNFWFNLRTYLTPAHENITQSYMGTVRYYTKSTNDYVSFIIGSGISPEESNSNLLNDNSYFKLKTFKVGAGYNFSVGHTHLFNVMATYYNQKYRPDTRGNQFDLLVGYIHTF